MGEIMLLVVIGTAIWVGIDASNLGVRRGRLGGGFLDMSVVGWVLCCLLFWIVALPCYVAIREKHQALNRSAQWTPGPAVNPVAMAAVPWGQAAPAPATWSQPAPAPTTSAQASPSPSPDGYFAVAPAAAPVTYAPPAAPPQLSPDGLWWWDGRQWVPARR